jgi:hypothetical protein
MRLVGRPCFRNGGARGREGGVTGPPSCSCETRRAQAAAVAPSRRIEGVLVAGRGRAERAVGPFPEREVAEGPGEVIVEARSRSPPPGETATSGGSPATNAPGPSRSKVT